MEYIERASFVDIYGLKLAYPISLLSLCFDFFKAHNITLVVSCQIQHYEVGRLYAQTRKKNMQSKKSSLANAKIFEKHSFILGAV